MATSKAKAKTASKKRTSKKRTTKKAATAKPAGYSDTTGQYTGANADFNIKALPAKERIEPRDGSLRAQCLAKMQKGGITVDGAIALCRAFDKKRGKKTNEDTVRRGYELVHLVAVANGYGAKEKEGKITVA